MLSFAGFVMKIKKTSNLNKCVRKVCNKISKCGITENRYFVDEVETQLREKSLWGSQTQDIHYSEDKTSYKAHNLMQWSYLGL
jgi:hypothetical protein